MFSFAEVENLCRYELRNESWEVNLRAQKVSPELLEPTLGINFARDGIQKKSGCPWLLHTAMHGYFMLHFTLVLDLVSIKIKG